MKKLSLLVLIFIATLNTITAQTVFRSDKYKFRIKYPDIWQYQKGDGENVVFKIVSSDNASLNIVVREDENFIGHTIDEIGIEKYISQLKKSMKTKYSDYEIIDYSETYIDNKPAIYVKSKITNRMFDYEKVFINIQYITSKGKYIYTFTAGATNDYFNYYESKFIEIISTFVFEDW